MLLRSMKTGNAKAKSEGCHRNSAAVHLAYCDLDRGVMMVTVTQRHSQSGQGLPKQECCAESEVLLY